MVTAPRATRTSRREFLKRLGSGVAAVGVGSVGHATLAACAPALGEPRHGSKLAEAEALLVTFADTHSAYQRYPQILAAVDALRARHPRVPMAILFNGDLFERGNAMALRGGGRVDLALLDGLVQRAPVVFNLGNHEGALFGMSETVRLLQDHGAAVVSNMADAGTGRMLAPPVASLEFDGRRMAVVGIATSHMATYRPEVRKALRIPSGPKYAPERLSRLLGDAPLRVVLSHEGTRDDRLMLPGIQDGTLVVGGHDHLRYTHRSGRTLYLHTGHWGASLSVVGIRTGPTGIEWVHEQVPIDEAAGDSVLAALVREEERAHLTADELAPVGATDRPLPFADAALLAVAAVRDAVGADVGLVANTTFGAGLPSGPVSRHRFDAFVRFDNALVRAEVDGATLGSILQRANQFDHTPFDHRTGEYVVATPLHAIDPARRYTVAADGWVRLNAERYLSTALSFTEVPHLRLKAVIARRLADGSVSPAA